MRGSAAVAREAPVPAATILMLAASCGLIVANIYYAQPLIGPIAASLGLAPHAAGLIVTMTQIGYAAGLVSWCRSAISSKTGRLSSLASR